MASPHFLRYIANPRAINARVGNSAEYKDALGANPNCTKATVITNNAPAMPINMTPLRRFFITVSSLWQEMTYRTLL